MKTASAQHQISQLFLRLRTFKKETRLYVQDLMKKCMEAASPYLRAVPPNRSSWGFRIVTGSIVLLGLAGAIYVWRLRKLRPPEEKKDVESKSPSRPSGQNTPPKDAPKPPIKKEKPFNTDAKKNNNGGDSILPQEEKQDVESKLHSPSLEEDQSPKDNNRDASTLLPSEDSSLGQASERKEPFAKNSDQKLGSFIPKSDEKSSKSMNSNSLETSWIEVPTRNNEPEVGSNDVSTYTTVAQNILQASVKTASGAVNAVLKVSEKLMAPDHIAKEMKYRIAFAHFFDIVIQNVTQMKPTWADVQREKKSDLKAFCQKIYNIILESQKAERIRKSYQDFVFALREAAKRATDEESVCACWIRALCYERFAGMKFFGYCKALVQLAAGPFQTPLSLENFWTELDCKNNAIRGMESGLHGSPVGGIVQKAQGFLNIAFDPLKTSNFPYIYGEVIKNGRVLKILRHGVPVLHTDWVGKKEKSVEITADFEGFIIAAQKKGEKILHIIFENSAPKYIGDESCRVTARLQLGEKHQNFFSIAFPMDGKFFEAAPPTNIEIFKKDFKAKLLEREIDKKSSKEVPHKETGILIPKKIRDQYVDFESAISKCIDDVQETYGFVNAITKQEYQAFLLLTYARLIHDFWETLDISILEAFCKDDIDRGGAFKAIFIVDHLYRTNQLTNEMLEQVMVHLIAAPLIVKKQAILPHRACFVQYVIDVLKKKPPVKALYDGTFRTLSTPCQGVNPIGNTIRTEEEY